MKTKMTIKADVLLQALVSVAPAIGKNNILPILEYVHVTGRGVSATSLNMRIVKKYTEPQAVEFSAVIDYNELKVICSNSKGYNVTIEVDGSKVVVKCENDVYKLNGESETNIPVMHVEETPETFDADESFINHLKTASLYVAGEKEIRENLRSVMITPYEDNIQVAGTDAYKMYVGRSKGVIRSKYCISPQFIAAIGEEVEGKISVGEKNISFESDRLSVTCKLIEAIAVDVSAYIPVSEKNVLFDKYQFLSAVRKANSLKGITPFTIVDLNFNKTGVEIIYEDSTLERSIKTECLMEHNLAGETIKLNATDLITALTSFDDNILHMAYIDKKQAIQILSDTPNELALLIPLVDLPKN